MTADEPLSAEELGAIRLRVEAATPGPWLTPDEAGDPYAVKIVDHEGCKIWPWDRAEDMVFAYKARDDVPRLLDEIDRLRASREGKSQ